MENKPTPQTNQIISIHTDKIVESPFEPQVRRREKFKSKQGTDGIKDLAESIVADGLQQPILVRPVRTHFEIVFGERRFLAHLLKGIFEIPCFVKNLSDAEVIKLQYIENHNRLEPDPLDDAFTFSYLKSEKNYSVHDLAIEFKMSEKNVLQRLKLNDLVPEAKKLLNDKILPIGHAVFMAALPEAAQKEIIDDALAFKYGDIKNGPETLTDFKDIVADEIICDLSNAPFDTENPELHVKKLICPNCTQRTGYEPKLFDGELAKGDRCLNRKCFEIKTNTNLRIKQEEIADKRNMPAATDDGAGDDGGGTKKTFDRKVASVPLVTERTGVEKSELPVKGKVLTNQTLLDEPECEFSEMGLAVAGAKKGREVWICRNDKCPTHHPENNPVADEKSESTDDELQQKEKRFQIDVAMTVREKVLAGAVEHFDGYNSFWQNADLVEKLLVEIVLSRWSYLKEIEGIFKNWKGCPKFYNRESVENFVGELDSRRRDQLLFLCVFAAEGFMLPDGEFKSQAEIERIAKSCAKVNYGDLDADARVELAPDEFKEIAEEYRADYRNDEPVTVPRFWWEGFEFPE